MNLQDVNDELREALNAIPSLTGRTYPHPVDDLSPPAGIVTFPDTIEFDGGYGRGMDRITGNVLIVAANVTSALGFELIAGYTDGAGAESVKAVLEGRQYVHLDSLRVTEVELDSLTIGSVAYIAALFTVDIVGPGST